MSEGSGATEELRAATREAHEAMKDMKRLMRDVEDLLARLHIAAHREVNGMLAEAVRAGMAEHQAAVLAAIDDGTKMVYARFAEIGDILMGEDRDSKRAGSAIQELAQRWVSEGT